MSSLKSLPDEQLGMWWNEQLGPHCSLLSNEQFGMC